MWLESMKRSPSLVPGRLAVERQPPRAIDLHLGHEGRDVVVGVECPVRRCSHVLGEVGEADPELLNLVIVAGTEQAIRETRCLPIPGVRATEGSIWVTQCWTETGRRCWVRLMPLGVEPTAVVLPPRRWRYW
jgi:hypothetical protein